MHACKDPEPCTAPGKHHCCQSHQQCHTVNEAAELPVPILKKSVLETFPTSALMQLRLMKYTAISNANMTTANRICLGITH